MESSEVVEGQASSLTSSATSDSDTSSLVETWTLVDKEEAKHVRWKTIRVVASNTNERYFQEDSEEILSHHEEEKGLDDKVPIGEYLPRYNPPRNQVFTSYDRRFECDPFSVFLANISITIRF